MKVLSKERAREETSRIVSSRGWILDVIGDDSVRDIVWPAADLIVWLDYGLAVSLRRRAGRSIKKIARLTRRRDPRALRKLKREARFAIVSAIRFRKIHRQWESWFRDLRCLNTAVVRHRTPSETEQWLSELVAQSVSSAHLQTSYDCATNAEPRPPLDSGSSFRR